MVIEHQLILSSSVTGEACPKVGTTKRKGIEGCNWKQKGKHFLGDFVGKNLQREWEWSLSS